MRDEKGNDDIGRWMWRDQPTMVMACPPDEREALIKALTLRQEAGDVLLNEEGVAELLHASRRTVRKLARYSSSPCDHPN